MIVIYFPMVVSIVFLLNIYYFVFFFQLEDSEHDRSVANCFTLYGSNKTVVIAASSPEEKERWMAVSYC